MSNKPVEIMVILDKSGSMSRVRDDTIGSFNTFIEDQKKLDGAATLSLLLFSNNTKTVINNEDLKTVLPLNRDSYVPDGSTALYDAISEGVSKLERRKPDRAVLVIITDGEENSSLHTRREQAKAMIERCEGYGWQVLYLGANQDAFAVGGAIGVKGINTANFQANAAGLRSASAFASSNTMEYRNAGPKLSPDDILSDEQKK